MGGLDMPCGYGARFVVSQGDGSADAALKLQLPVILKRLDYGRRGRNRALARAAAALGAAEQCARGSADRIALQKLGERGALPSAHDLEETKSVHGGALEGLRKDCVEGFRC